MTAAAHAVPAPSFLERLGTEGTSHYHDRHPFHVLMHAGRLSCLQLQQWVLNRYYALDFVLRHATTPDVQDRCVAALVRKNEVLWHLLDCVQHAGGATA